MSKYPHWTPAEADYLDRLAGDVPFPVLVKRFQRTGLEQGWPPRSGRAILQRLYRNKQRGRARHGAAMTTGGVAEILGCPGTRVEAWLRRQRIRELLAPRWIGKTRYINRSAWHRLAREMPRVLGGFSADNLFALLEDRELADEIASRYSQPLGDWRVRCVETGEVFASCGAVAAAHHVTQACISLAIRQRRTVPALGLTFEALRISAN